MKYIIATIFILQVVVLQAQDKYYYLTLDMNKPLSNQSWIKDATASGFRGGVRGFINDKFSAGIDVGWANYDQYVPRATYVDGTKSVTTDYFNYLYSFTAVASTQYNFHVGDGERIFPYAGIGVGTEGNEYVKYYNAYKDRDKSWGFLARPEAGILVKFTRYRAIGAMAAVHYDFATNRSKVFGYNNFSNVGFLIGLVFLQM